MKEYLDGLPPDRRAAISKVRAVIRKHLPRGYQEGIGWGMLWYSIPLARYPDTHNGQPLGIAALGSQKNYMAIYLMGVYSDPEVARWFADAYRKSGKTLDMGKSCVRFRKVDDLPLDVIAKTIARVSVEDFIAQYEATRGKKKTPSRKPAGRPERKTPARRAATGTTRARARA